MKKTDDPYTGISKILHQIGKREGIQPGIGIGVIVSPPPAIQVAYNGMILDTADLYIDEYWLPGHTRHIVGATDYRSGGSGDAEYASHNHPIDNDEKWTDTWKTGDKVALLPIYSSQDMQSAQQYIVLAKLVRLDGE
nr:MAG TPA: Protein of unknown function (DUF2577) [Caudoviricetes sp.]